MKIIKRLKNSKISFDGIYNHSTDKFFYITILPTIDFIIDKQMQETFNIGDRIEGGIYIYSLGFQWLKFSFYLNLEYNIK